jgi:peroxiredoxin
VIPQLRAWDERYRAAGLTVIGVHSPEFFWERSRDSVVAAARKLGIGYAVVQDNDFAIWKRYAVRGWPTTFLIDRRGILRHRHIGEGAYDETEALIRQLLSE